MEKNVEKNASKFKITKPALPLHALDKEKNDAHNEQSTGVDITPNVHYYRNMLSVNGDFKSRPTLEELQNLDTSKKNSNSNKHHELKKERSFRAESIVKFGWIKGVLIRCILNIFGVMIFLRISWVVGQAGVGLASIVVLLASFVTFLTALSLSAICTNGEVKGGGAYYLISRSLGPEFGGAIGIVYAFANAVAAAMYVVGFAESFVQLLKDNNVTMLDGGINDIRIVGMITNLILLLIALIGMKWEAKVQIFLLIILVLALFNFIVGSFIPHASKEARGFVGYSFKALKENFLPDFRGGEDFAHVFGVFFPAVTGILAGANISGNLKNPQQAIPKGTILSIFITSFVYLVFCWICGLTVVRDATGDYSSNRTHFNCVNTTCKYGLTNSYQVMEMVSEIPAILRGNSPIIIAGIFSASLSSALASIVSAPKIFQAVASDKIFPKIDYFAVGHGKDNEPWRGYFLTFIIASLFIALGELNVIAPIISNFFLMSYALVNYSCFDASIAKTPGWRPAFKYYNKWVSLFGSLLCITVMFLIEWWAALVSFVVVAGFYVYVKQTKPDVNWGSSTQAHIYRRSLEYSLKLINTEEHVKNFRPNFLVLTGMPNFRPALCDLISAVTKNTSLMACAHVKLTSDLNDPDSADNNPYKWLRKRRIKSFYTEINAGSLRSGAVSLMQCVGVGKLRPNTLAMGFKNHWQRDTWQSVLEYYQIINDAFQMNYGLCILRVEPGLDLSELFDCSQECSLLNDNDYNSDSSLDEIGIQDSLVDNNLTQTDLKNANIEYIVSQEKSNLDENNNNLNASPTRVEFDLPKSVSPGHSLVSEDAITTSNTLRKDLFSNNGSSGGNLLKSTQVIKLKNTKINKGMLQGVNLFHKKYRNGFVDVWWLFDDGGLTILIPYLLMQRKHWAKCKLRIFIQTKNENVDLTEEQRKMAAFVSKFRIKFHDLIVFSLFEKKPDPSNIIIHETLIENWRLKPNEKAEDFPWKITDDMYKANIDKTNSHLILRDLLMQYSQNSELVLITISVPSKLNTCAALFLSWLDLISHQMPPVLLIRGNQAPVLTYYS